MSVDETTPSPPPDPELDRTRVGGSRPVPDPKPTRRPTPELPVIAGVRLEGELARGGMGVVYRGVQEYLSRPVAVKVLAAHLDAGDFVARFQREARILSGIAHSHIVGCYQAGVTDAGQCYMVMEFVDGPSLRRHVEANGPLPVTAVLRMGADLARALDHAWQAGVIHRDVKPENVVLQRTTKSGDVTFPFVPKLVDLGLARADSVADGLTAPGAVMGTYSTMAPEQFDAPDAVDFRADLYGLGCVLYHALTGKAAFPQPSMAAVIQRKLASPAPDPCAIAPSVPAEVGALVQAMLAADREQRPASYERVVAECERLRIAASRGSTTAQKSGTAAATRLDLPAGTAATLGPPRRGRARALAGLGVLVVAAAGAWFWFGRHATEGPSPPVTGGGETGREQDPEPGEGNRTPEPAPKPPPPRVAPTLSVQAPATIGPGDTLALEAVALDADTPELTYSWVQVSGYPAPLAVSDQAKTHTTLVDCVPGSDLVFAATVDDHDHAPVRQEVRVRVVDPNAVALFPEDTGHALANWQTDGQGSGSWTTYDAFVISGFCKDGLSRLRTSLPAGPFTLSGKVALEVDFTTKKLPTAAGVMLPFEGGGALALWLGPGEGDLARGELGGLADVAAWPPDTVGEGPMSWPQPAALHFHLIATAATLRFLWGAGTDWRSIKLDRPEQPCCLELFVRDGQALFHDLRR